MARPQGTNVPSDVVFRVADLFLQALPVKEIISVIAKEMNHKLHRQEVYRIVSYARREKLIRLIPPLNQELERKVYRAFELPEKKHIIRVVRTPRAQDNYLVAEVAADVAFERAKKLVDAGEKSISLGLTTGRACLDFSTSFATRLSSDGFGIPLSLHALAGGGPSELPEFSPVSFFNLYKSITASQAMGAMDENAPNSVGLFTQTLCRAALFADVQGQAGFANALKHRNRINLIITALGSPADPHDLWRRSIEEEESVTGKSMDFLKWANENQIMGNIGYRPYTNKGPYVEKDEELKAVTLFDIPELVEFAKAKDKYTVLIVRRCGLCSSRDSTLLRARSLLPLLQSPNLRVFTDLVVDEAVAVVMLDLIKV